MGRWSGIGLRICILARKKKKLKHAFLSFEVANLQIRSCLLFS